MEDISCSHHYYLFVLFYKYEKNPFAYIIITKCL